MSGYILHPEAYIDIDELWEFIAQDNLDATDRVREEIYETIQALISLPPPGTPTTRAHHPARAIHAGAGFSHCLCAR